MPWSEVESKMSSFESNIRRKGELSYGIEDKCYDNLEYYIDIIITGESQDTQAKQQLYQFAMSAVASNPQLLVSPTTRLLFFKLLEQTGEPTASRDIMQEAVNSTAQNAPQTQPEGQGVGGVAAPPAQETGTNLPSAQV